MRTMQRNKQEMWFSNYNSGTTIYERDSEGNIIYETYVDPDGTSYKYPKEIGVETPGYTTPVKFEANISMSGGDVEAKEFGLDVSQYSAVLVCPKDAYDIDEKTLIWFQSAIAYKDTEQTEIEPNSADYRVVKVSPSVNYVRYVLQRIVHNE